MTTNSTTEPVAFLVVSCPDFPYLPSLYYDQVVPLEAARRGWKAGFASYALFEVLPDEATHYLTGDNQILERGRYAKGLEDEWVLAAVFCGKTILHVKAVGFGAYE